MHLYIYIHIQGERGVYLHLLTYLSVEIATSMDVIQKGREVRLLTWYAQSRLGPSWMDLNLTATKDPGI